MLALACRAPRLAWIILLALAVSYRAFAMISARLALSRAHVLLCYVLGSGSMAMAVWGPLFVGQMHNLQRGTLFAWALHHPHACFRLLLLKPSPCDCLSAVVTRSSCYFRLTGWSRF
jgi:hypothetical protein